MDFDDFNFDDFQLDDFKPTYRAIDICGLVQKMKSKQRMMFNIGSEHRQLQELVKNPPKKNECFKMLSVGGGFSSLGIIKFVAELEPIEEMYVSTFRIGKKHFEVLLKLHEDGKLKICNFVTSESQKEIDSVAMYKGKRYNYYDFLLEQCDNNGWKLKAFDNHSKIILMKTKNSWYVVETSSNLNENPKMEQFSWENDKSLYEWYEKMFTELLSC